MTRTYQLREADIREAIAAWIESSEGMACAPSDVSISWTDGDLDGEEASVSAAATVRGSRALASEPCPICGPLFVGRCPHLPTSRT